MFTVLIAEKEHIDAIRNENRLFFEPFLDSKELAFCCWNPSGQNLLDSVPELYDTVGRHKNWRAVIINTSTVESSKKRNPFDAVDSSALNAVKAPSRQPETEEAMDKWEEQWKNYFDALTKAKESVYRSALEDPFTKLSTWLCFRPEDYIYNDIEEKHDVHDWAMEKIGRDEHKASYRLEMMERDQYKRELRMKENIRKDFVNDKYMNIVYPSEVYCISPRAAENNYFDPSAYWTIYQDSEYSTFADRNMYFDKMRFMVFDILAQTHRNFRTDYIRFLATVLIFISNAVPGSAMQARKLYQLEAETDDSPLCTLVTSYDRKLAATAAVIEGEMEQIRNSIPGELTDRDAEKLFCTDKDVAVLMDESCNQDKVLTEKNYGLFYDSPENEFDKWNRNYNESLKTLNYMVKQQFRSVRRSVGQMHAASEVSDANVSRLTPLQIEDVREYTESAEDEMVASIPRNITDTSKYTKKLAEKSDEVKKAIKRRMDRKTVIIISAVCLAIYFVCFMPFLFSNNGTVQTVLTAAILSLSMLGIMAAVMVITLFCLRKPVTDAVKEYNQAAKGITNDIRATMKNYSKYLSASCNVRRGHAVQNYAKSNIDEYAKGLRVRKKHMEDIRKKRAFLEEGYADYFGDRSFCDEAMSRPYEYDFDQPVEFKYPAPFLAGDCRQIEFISNGNMVTVPSSYIKRILVSMEGIYEK